MYLLALYIIDRWLDGWMDECIYIHTKPHSFLNQNETPHRFYNLVFIINKFCFLLSLKSHPIILFSQLTDKCTLKLVCPNQDPMQNHILCLVLPILHMEAEVQRGCGTCPNHTANKCQNEIWTRSSMFFQHGKCSS